MQNPHKHIVISNRPVKNIAGKTYYDRKEEKRYRNYLHYCVQDLEQNHKDNDTWYDTPVRPWTDEEFNQSVLDTLRNKHNIPEEDDHELKGKTVTLFIHGWEFKYSWKLDLFYEISQSWIHGPIHLTDLFLFVAWPSGGLIRHKADDRTWEMGQDFSNSYQRLISLSEFLRSKGIRFELMTHSFGHLFLNGFLSKIKTSMQQEIFDRYLSFAPDIFFRSVTNRKLGSRGGVKLTNPKNSLDKSKTRWFDLTPMHVMSKESYFFIDHLDLSLYKSSLNYVAKLKGKFKEMKKKKIFPDAYHMLGYYGLRKISGRSIPESFTFLNATAIMGGEHPFTGDLAEIVPMMKAISGKNNYPHWTKNAFMLSLEFVQDDFGNQEIRNRHRYFYTSQNVRLVLEKLKKGDDIQEDLIHHYIS